MRRTLSLTVMIATLSAAAPVLAPTAADARTYYGSHHRYYYHCRRSRGRTGLIAGAGVGGLGAAALGAGPVGIAAGVVGGGLLGRHIDKRHDAAQNRRNGC